MSLFGKPKRVPQINEKWYRRFYEMGPWPVPEDLGHVRIIDVKENWVRYSRSNYYNTTLMSWDYISDSRLKLADFLQLYKPEEDL